MPPHARDFSRVRLHELMNAYNNGDATAEDISNWLSDTIGFCHNGFHIIEE